MPNSSLYSLCFFPFLPAFLRHHFWKLPIFQNEHCVKKKKKKNSGFLKNRKIHFISVFFREGGLKVSAQMLAGKF